MSRQLFTILMLSFLMFPVIAGNKDKKPAEVPKTAVIQGLITDKDTGETLAGVSVRMESPEKSSYSGTDGTFSLDDLDSGIYTIHVNCISYTEKTLKVDVKNGRNDLLKIGLEPIAP